jgi:hypothetical protein
LLIIHHITRESKVLIFKRAKVNFYTISGKYPKQKERMAYGKGLEVLFSEYLVLYSKTDCLSVSELSVLEYAQHKIFRELGLLIPWNEA